MFSDMIKSLPCETCEEGKMYYSNFETVNAWQDPHVFALDNVDKLVDAVLSDILVFICPECGTTVRYTFKEVEKIFRKNLSKIILTKIAMGDMPDPGSFNKKGRIITYCGQCSGFDGKGSCPAEIYNVCELKRLPRGS